MKNFESLIAKLLLIGYLLTLVAPALPAKSLNHQSPGMVKKVCKRSYAMSQNDQHTPLKLTFSSAKRTVKEVPQAVLLSACGSANTYLPARSVNELLLIPQQEKDYPVFGFKQYTILFQELDPDPPRAPFC